MNKRIAATSAGLALLGLGTTAGVVGAQAIGGSPDVMYAEERVSPYDVPSNYAEGLTLGEMNVQYSPGCNGYGRAETTRLGTRVVQTVTITQSYEAGTPAGTVCNRWADVAQNDYFQQLQPAKP